jgi:hypothetical protein
MSSSSEFLLSFIIDESMAIGKKNRGLVLEMNPIFDGCPKGQVWHG